MANSGNLSPAESWDYNHNLYILLGVPQNADIGTIKHAYYKLMRKHHPDKDGGSAEVAGRLNHAFEIMSDLGERAKYDNMLNDIQNNAEFHNLQSVIISTTRRAHQVNKPRVSKKVKSTKKDKQKRRRVNHQIDDDEHPKPIRGGGGNGSLSSDANEKMPADDNVSNKSSKSRGGKKKKQKVKNSEAEVIDLVEDSPNKKMSAEQNDGSDSSSGSSSDGAILNMSPSFPTKKKQVKNSEDGVINLEEDSPDKKMSADDDHSIKSRGKKKMQKVKTEVIEMIEILEDTPDKKMSPKQKVPPPDKKMKQVDKGPHGEAMELLFDDDQKVPSDDQKMSSNDVLDPGEEDLRNMTAWRNESAARARKFAELKGLSTLKVTAFETAVKKANLGITVDMFKSSVKKLWKDIEDAGGSTYKLGEKLGNTTNYEFCGNLYTVGGMNNMWHMKIPKWILDDVNVKNLNIPETTPVKNIVDMKTGELLPRFVVTNTSAQEQVEVEDTKLSANEPPKEVFRERSDSVGSLTDDGSIDLTEDSEDDEDQCGNRSQRSSVKSKSAKKSDPSAASSSAARKPGAASFFAGSAPKSGGSSRKKPDAASFFAGSAPKSDPFAASSARKPDAASSSSVGGKSAGSSRKKKSITAAASVGGSARKSVGSARKKTSITAAAAGASSSNLSVGNSSHRSNKSRTYPTDLVEICQVYGECTTPPGLKRRPFNKESMELLWQIFSDLHQYTKKQKEVNNQYKTVKNTLLKVCGPKHSPIELCGHEGCDFHCFDPALHMSGIKQNCGGCCIKICDIEMLPRSNNVTKGEDELAATPGRYRYTEDGITTVRVITQDQINQGLVVCVRPRHGYDNDICKQKHGYVNFHVDLTIKDRHKKTIEELNAEINAIAQAKRQNNDRYRAAATARKVKKIADREAHIQDAYDRVTALGIENKDQVINPKDYLLWDDPRWYTTENANEIIHGQGGFQGHDVFGRRGIHISPVKPNKLQTLPGQPSNHSLGPNDVLTVPTLEEIPHCTPTLAANTDKRAWFGGLGARKAIKFFQNHYHLTYPFNGEVYYMYGFEYDNDLLVHGNQYHMGDVRLPMIQHVGLCELNCAGRNADGKPILEHGPFMRYDWCVSFKTNTSGDPSTFKYRLLRVKDTNGTVCDVDLDLEENQPLLTATLARLVYNPAKDVTTKGVVDLLDE